MLSRLKTSLINLASFEKAEIISLFSLAERLSQESSAPSSMSGATAALIFFEPSTRTRMSFETACVRSGVYPLMMDGRAGSSLEKGESLEDTILNVAAMGPEFMVIRSGEALDMESIQRRLNIPLINAGWGHRSHPTQALLDAYTIQSHLGSCEKQRLLIVGDIKHSRVAASHFELAQILHYEVGLWGPQEFLPTETTKARVFSSLEEGLGWATVAMPLRVQFERHQQKYSLHEYRSRFALTRDSLKMLSDKALILHPGPVNIGTELDSDILCDPRVMILNQVKNGVFVRQALIQTILSQGAL